MEKEAMSAIANVLESISVGRRNKVTSTNPKLLVAEKMEKEAMSAIANVLESISLGRRNKVTSINPKLVLAEEEANQAIYKLDQAKSRRAVVQSKASVMEEYKDLVEAGREQFHKEMASIMPDVKLGEKNGKLTEEELNMFI